MSLETTNANYLPAWIDRSAFLKKLAKFLPLILMLGPFRLFSVENPPAFEHYSLEQGLSQSVIFQIHKDNKGFMWFGTQSGLNKFDGYQFHVYQHIPFDSTSLSDNNIQVIFEDRTGTLWLGTSGGGLNRFDRAHGTFTHYRNRPGDSTSLSNDIVRLIHEDRQGYLWVVTIGGGLDRLDPATGKFKRYQNDPGAHNSLSHNAITLILEDCSGTLWIGTLGGLNKYQPATDDFFHYLHDPKDSNTPSSNRIITLFEAASNPGILWIGTGDPPNLHSGAGLNRLDLKTGTWRHYRNDPENPNSLSDDFITQLHQDKDGYLWVGTTRGLNRLEPAGDRFRRFLPDSGNPHSLANVILLIHEDIKKRLWLTTLANDGIYCFDPEKLTFDHYVQNENNPASLSNNQILSIYGDSTGILWLGTNTGGINKLDLFSQKFKTFAHIPGNPNSLSNNLVRAIYEDHQGELWVGVGNNGGLNRFDSERKRVKHYYFNPDDPNSLSNNNVWALYEDKSQVLWVGTLGGGLNRFNRKTEKFTRYRNDPGNPHSLGSDFVRVFFEDRWGNFWIGTDGGGLNKFDRKKDSFISYRNDPHEPNSLSSNLVRAIAEDSSGVLWIGTYGGGLERFDPATGKFYHYRYDLHNTNSLSQNTIQAIYVDKTGKLWIGTFGGGLNRFDPATATFTHYTEKNSSICNNVVYGILCDDRRNLWFSTNKGISQFDPALNTFKNYDIDDGLQSKEFNGQSYFKNKRGEMFFGGINGFNAFFPDSIKNNPTKPNIAITDFKLFNTPVPIGPESPLKKDISETQEIWLNYRQHDISFEFVALHFNRPDQNKYAYMLENYDTDWRWAGSQRTATYTNLDPGEYIFRVKGSNNDEVWNETGASVRVIIAPPWWQTVWAYFLYAFILLTVVMSGYRLQRARVIKIERNKARIREAELRALAAEAQTQVVQAENARKSAELEKARKLQLSMLPRQVPTVPNLEIAVHMHTATEVGGDYYDFYLDENGQLTVVIGDATGHGLNAGTMVSVIKSLFIANASQANIHSFFRDCTRTIKQLNLGNLFMGLTLVKIKNDQLIAAAAGMPPIYIYQKNKGRVEEIVLKGMPLGAFIDFSYQDRRVKLNPGDVVLLLSDGFPELFNEIGEMLDYARVKEAFSASAHRNPDEIIAHLVQVGESWRNGNPLTDDITFVVLKMRESVGDENLKG